MDPRWAYLSVFVFDFNALGVVHVPHLRKPTGPAARPRRAGRGRGPAAAGPGDRRSLLAALTHVTSEKSRRPVP